MERTCNQGRFGDSAEPRLTGLDAVFNHGAMEPFLQRHWVTPKSVAICAIHTQLAIPRDRTTSSRNSSG
jgi:hypothetical protein